MSDGHHSYCRECRNALDRGQTPALHPVAAPASELISATEAAEAAVAILDRAIALYDDAIRSDRGRLRKRCSTCGRLRLLGDYVSTPSSPDGHTRQCRECAAEAWQADRKSRTAPTSNPMEG